MLKQEVPDPFDKIILPDNFNRKYSPLSENLYPVYHDVLKKSNHPELSYKVDKCGIDGIRLTCSKNYQHSYVLPINCKRRTCPECSRLEMLSRFHQFKPIIKIIKDTNARPGSKLPQEWRCRLVTLTCKAKKGQNLQRPLESVKKAFFEFWRNVYGVKSEFKKYSDIIGGLWYIEIQSGWNVHMHGIVLSPFIKTDYLQKIWKKYIEYYGWYGWICHQVVIYSGVDHKGNPKYNGNYENSLFEVLNYPVKPNKIGRHDQELLANVELAMYKKRRMYLKGSWYKKFPKQKNECTCPVCGSEFTILIDKEEQKLFGETFKNSIYPYTPEGVDNFKTYSKISLTRDYFNEILKNRSA